MSEPTPDRPRQVTMAGWLLMIGSALVVVLVYQRVAGLHSLETRTSVEEFLAEPPGADLGLTVDAVISGMRVIAMVTGACAAAVAILGYQVLNRSRSARLVVTVLAVPLFVGGLVAGGFLTSVVAASAVLLWMQPARSWFNGTPLPERYVAASGAARRSEPTGPDHGTGSFGPGSPAAHPAHGPGPSSEPFGQAGAPAYGAPAPGAHVTGTGRRPAAVVGACLLTWIFAGLTVLGLAASATVLALDPDPLLAEAHRQNPDLAEQGISDDLLVAVTFVVLAGVLLWCVSAAVLAVLAFRRVAWARIVLVISAATAAALCLIGTALGAVVLLPAMVGAAVAVGMLLRPDVRAWYAER